MTTAGCGRDRIYKEYSSWLLFIEDVKKYVEIPDIHVNPNKKEPKYNNKCVFCGIAINSEKYCSIQCQHNQQLKQKIDDFESGKYINKNISGENTKWFKKYLKEKYDNTCCSCNLKDTYNNLPINLEIDHIDGHCFNNIPSNIRLLCPNCHSQTETYKAKNKVSDNKLRYKK